MKPIEHLQKRFIAEQAKLLGWIETKNYWEYPLFAPDGSIIAYRQKKYPDAPIEGKKYLWKNGKPEDLDTQWYIAPDTKDEIEKAGGLAYLANGSPAMIAYRVAGIRNVLATELSEIAFPKDGVKYLKSIGISAVLYPVDKDEAGMQSAINWRDDLAGSGIDFIPLQWPDTMPAKADANDVLIYCKGNAEEFNWILRECTEEIELPAHIPQKERKSQSVISPDFQGAYAKLSHDIFEALSARGYLTGKRFSSGFYQMRCLHHEEKEASAGYHPDSGVINCFRCGTHKIKENALALNIDIESYFPKRDNGKKPKRAEFKAFEAALEILQSEKQVDMRTYKDFLADEIMGREVAFSDKQYLGFGGMKDFPLGILSAVLNLCNGRSSLALFLLKMHHAMVTGKIGTIWTESEAMAISGMSRNAVFRSLFEAEHLGFVSFLSGYIYKDSIQDKETAQKGGRPAKSYMVELDRSAIVNRLSKMLEIYCLEKHCKKVIAMPSSQMASQVKLSETDEKYSYYLEWRDRAKTALSETANKQAKAAYDIEMFGNGNWKGWIRALDTNAAAPICIDKCEDCQDLRAELLSWWVTKRDINSRDELCRLLGCTDPVIDKLLDKCNLINERQQKKVEFKTPETVRQMAYAWNKNQRDLQGVCWKGGLWVSDEKAWIPVDNHDYLETFAQLSGRVKKAYMLVIMPSKQRPMTEDEIELRDAKLKAEKEAEMKAMAKDTPQTESATNSPVKTEKKADSEKIAEPKRYRYPLWDKHSYAFLYRQLQLIVHCFSLYALIDHAIMDKKGNCLISGELPDLFAWIAEHGSKAPVRKLKSFYGKDYDEEKDFDALQALADERKSKLKIVDSIEFEDEDVTQLPIFQEDTDYSIVKKVRYIDDDGYIPF